MKDQVLIQPTITAAIAPEKFPDPYQLSRRALIFALAFLLLAGFGLRVYRLGAESLGEDELNKLQTVAEYRSEGLTGRNGEHPFLMKGLQTISIIAAEKWNNNIDSPSAKISEEAALRFPTALFGTFTALLIFLLINELFGSSAAIIAAALWAVDPNAVGFDRIAKEDSFLLFFFLLGNFFWIRGQTRAERDSNNWLKFVWLAAIAFGAMLASKYLLHLLGIGAAYYYIFQAIPATKWRLGKVRWLKFFVLLGIGFVIFNPTILLPDTWREMLVFSTEKRIGHDAYEFAGTLYRNKVTLWLAGVPWTFYYLFILAKTPLLTLFFFFAGIPVFFRRKLGDGRFFVFFWAFMWFLPFTFLGGKFTRYFTVAEPLILISAAIGLCFSARWLAEKLFADNFQMRRFFVWILPLIVLFASFFASFSIAPHYRLYLNQAARDYYFPHDEFYDTSTREIVGELAKSARQNALIAVETPYLFEYYARQSGRADLNFVSLSDKEKTAGLATGDDIVAVRGRRYFSNDYYLNFLENSAAPFSEIKVGDVTSARIYRLDETTAAGIRELAK